MITKVKIITHLLPHIVKIVNFCVCIVRMLKIINSQVYIAILLTIVTMLYISSPELILNTTDNFYPLTYNVPFSPHPRPWQSSFFSVSMKLAFVLDSTTKWYYTVLVFLKSDLFHLA